MRAMGKSTKTRPAAASSTVSVQKSAPNSSSRRRTQGASPSTQVHRQVDRRERRYEGKGGLAGQHPRATAMRRGQAVGAP